MAKSKSGSVVGNSEVEGSCITYLMLFFHKIRKVEESPNHSTCEFQSSHWCFITFSKKLEIYLHMCKTSSSFRQKPFLFCLGQLQHLQHLGHGRCLLNIWRLTNGCAYWTKGLELCPKSDGESSPEACSGEEWNDHICFIGRSFW